MSLQVRLIVEPIPARREERGHRQDLSGEARRRGSRPAPPGEEGEEEPYEGSPPEGAAPSDSGQQPAGDDPELELLVYGERFKIKRSKLVDAYNLEGLPDHVIVSIAQKHMAADQRLARVKEREAANPPHGSEPEHSEAPAPGAPEPTNPSARAYAPEADGLDPGLSPGRAKPALITGKAQRDR